jgi:hypothetical protein
MASFQGLAAQGGKTIPSKLMTAVINGKKVPIGTDRVPIATGRPTPFGGTDLPIVVEVTMKGSPSYPAGRYSGSLVLSVVAGS